MQREVGNGRAGAVPVGLECKRDIATGGSISAEAFSVEKGATIAPLAVQCLNRNPN